MYFKLPNRETAYVDVDETLICWAKGKDIHDPKTKPIEVVNGTLIVYLHINNIELVKNLFTIGWNIIIWSKGGSDHAEKVILAVGLKDYIHAIIPKPTTVIDDKSIAEQAKDWPNDYKKERE